MSDTIPRFIVGDHVRIMQTSEMEANGYANKRGKITSVDNTVVGDSGPEVMVELDEPLIKTGHWVTAIRLFASSLMKCEEPKK